MGNDKNSLTDDYNNSKLHFTIVKIGIVLWSLVFIAIIIRIIHDCFF